MKRAHLLVLSFALALFLGACGGGDDKSVEKLGGSWVLDLNATIENNESMKNSIPAGEAGDMARGMLEAMLGSMTLTFDVKAKTFSGSLMGETIENKAFEVVSVKGDDFEIKIDGETAPFTLKGDELRMKGPDGAVLVFQRKK